MEMRKRKINKIEKSSKPLPVKVSKALQAIAESKAQEMVSNASVYQSDFLDSLKVSKPSSKRFKKQTKNDQNYETLLDCFHATVFLAQEECGTAICIRSSDLSGVPALFLTCAHCVQKVLQVLPVLSTSGRLIYTRCVARDLKKDCALLEVLCLAQNIFDSFQVISCESALISAEGSTFKAVALAAGILMFDAVEAFISKDPPPNGMPVFCVGQPGREDLESKVGIYVCIDRISLTAIDSGGATGYPLVSTSVGKIRGYIPGIY